MSDPDFTSCPNWGVGGRYVVDPVTGERNPVPEPEPDADAATALALIAADTVGDASPEKSSKKGK